MKVANLGRAVGLASVILLGAVGSASAADQWTVISEKTIKATDPSTEIKAEDGKDVQGEDQADQDLGRGR